MLGLDLVDEKVTDAIIRLSDAILDPLKPRNGWSIPDAAIERSSMGTTIERKGLEMMLKLRAVRAKSSRQASS